MCFNQIVKIKLNDFKLVNHLIAWKSQTIYILNAIIRWIFQKPLSLLNSRNECVVCIVKLNQNFMKMRIYGFVYFNDVNKKRKGFIRDPKQKKNLTKFSQWVIFWWVKFYSNCYRIAEGQKRMETSHPEKCHSLCSKGKVFWKTFTNC